MTLKKPKRYKVLLDEGLHLPRCYPKLNKFHNVLHVSSTKLRGEKDKKIFDFAAKEKRIVVVFNIKHFRNFIDNRKPSIISLSVGLSDKAADEKICKALKMLKPSGQNGSLISITKEGIRVLKINENIY